MSVNKEKKVALVTGSAGFIGFHMSKKLLSKGWRVVGLDSLSQYYDVSLKICREGKLKKFANYRSVHAKVEQPCILENLLAEEKPNIVIHLAAQAGVRYSIENPRSYLESNVFGTFELLEAARKYPPKHLLLASTSSVYGSSKNLPYKENDNSDHQFSFYAATKKSTENLAHSYAHLFQIPITVFRFFTVYGPWGRPDMALFKFTKAILNEEKINIFNFGKMERDFTYIDDLVEGVNSLLHHTPNNKYTTKLITSNLDSKSTVAPFRVVNIGNSKPICLMEFVYAIEAALGKKAKINLLPMQAGDIKTTWADNSLISAMTGYTSKTDINTGVQKFVDWFKDYYKV